MEILKSTLYLREYIYRLSQGYDIEYKALSYKQLDSIRGKYSLKTNSLIYNTVKLALVHKEDIGIITYVDLLVLYDNIIEASTLGTQDVDKIKTAVSISLEDTFKGETFSSCKLCQEKRMDKNRNCPFISKDKHDSAVFYIVDGRKIDICPMSEVNTQLVSDAFACYSMLEARQLPTSGGRYDQSVFFVEVSSIVKGMVDKHTSKELDKK